MRQRLAWWALSGGLLFLLAGCAQRGGARRVEVAPPPPASTAPPAAASEAGIIFIANGAGGSTVLSDHLIDLVRETKLPLRTEVVTWTLGQGAIADHEGVARHAEAGEALASRVAAYRAAHPEKRVTLIGHSSGTHVVLLAAEALPENSIDRVILLAPSVAASYDLAPALRASRGGIDSFCSVIDGVLELADTFLDTADGKAGPAAGRGGFVAPPPGSPVAPLYRRLRQHRYQPGYQVHGNFGGHYGWTRTGFLRHVVLPML
jgi:pimeloyl-ACP methyl ester carboxylesterase